MNQPFYYFNQLFEKLPNGQYRERDKPAPLDPDRNWYFRDGETGKIKIMYSVSVSIEFLEFDTSAKKEPIDWFSLGNWTGGSWASGALVNKPSNRQITWNASSYFEDMNGNRQPFLW